MGHRGCAGIVFLACAADGVLESHFNSHTEPVLAADKSHRIVGEDDSASLISSLMISLVLVIMVRPKARP